jgi:hypothetical protein
MPPPHREEGKGEVVPVPGFEREEMLDGTMNHHHEVMAG